jgi:hypothetical protein
MRYVEPRQAVDPDAAPGKLPGRLPVGKKFRPPAGEYFVVDLVDNAIAGVEETTWRPPARPAAPAEARPGTQGWATTGRPAARSAGPGSARFSNPYGFVPFDYTNKLLARRDHRLAAGLAHGPARSQAVWHGDSYSGKLALRLETTSPLLTLEVQQAGQKKPDRSAKFSVRRDREGNPIIGGASIKGVLRVLFEAVTDSRLAVFGHDKPLSRWVDREKVTFPYSPADLLGPLRRPARRAEEMSAADRVFGWVPGKGGDERGVRGLLRCGGVRCDKEVKSPPLGTGASWLIASLSVPRPTQARFYLVTLDGDEPEPFTGGPREFYTHQELAGFKVYPHHRLEPGSDYWDFPAEGWAASPGDPADHPKDSRGHFKNYLAARGAKPLGAMLIDGFVGIGSQFETTLYFDDLSRADLAALLWVLRLGAVRPEDPPGPRHHRLGQGKALGFGSVALTIDWGRSTLLTAADVFNRYAAGSAKSSFSEADCTALMAEYDDLLHSTVPAIRRSIIHAASGLELPIHTPRLAEGATGEVPPQTETYKWFVQNDRGLRLALQPLADDDVTLPADPRRPRGAR